jgi:hypothetical protein
MIIKGGARNNAAFYVTHLQRVDTNERVHVAETRGFAIEGDVEAAFQDIMGIASGTKCKNPFYVVSINPDEDERLTPAQWQEAVDRVEHRLGLDGQARIVIEHQKHDRIHCHVVWSRVDLATMGVISDSFNYQKHEQASREIEEAFGLRHVDSVLTKDRDRERPERRPADWESFRAADTAIDPQQMKRDVTALWNAADSGLSFHAALTDAGYILAKGDRRDFVIVDQAGDDHSLARRISGARAADIRTRLADVDRDSLPSVAEARELARAAADSADAETPQEGALEAASGPIAGSAATTERAAERAAALSDATADITPDVDNYLARRFGDRTEVSPLERGSDSELAPVEKGGAQDAPALERGTPPDTSEKHFGWRAFSDRVRSYVERAFDVWLDESSGTPDGEHGPWERLVGAAKHLVRGYTRRDLDEFVQGASEAIDLFVGNRPDASGDDGVLPTDSKKGAGQSHGKEALRHFDTPEDKHSPPADPRREPARPDAQVDASEPDDRPQKETPAVTKPMTELDRMRAEYFADWDASQETERGPEAEPMDGTAPAPPDYDAPDMD